MTWWQLRNLARAQLRNERADHTLSPTALVNETYLRLRDRDGAVALTEEHFVRLAGWMMRRVLVDHARRRGASKRTEPDAPEAEPEQLSLDADTLADLERALRTLEEVSARQADIFRLRVLADLEFSEIAERLGVTERTIYREWRMARAFLSSFLELEAPP